MQEPRNLDHVREPLGMYDRRIDGPYVASVWMSHRVQPCKERVHPLYEYTGRRDPTREADGDVPDADLRDRLAKVFDMSGYTVPDGMPHAFQLSDPPPMISPIFRPLGQFMCLWKKSWLGSLSVTSSGERSTPLCCVHLGCVRLIS